jgi:hypothetical protein
MCSFVLLAGVHRTVPPQARLMVHQIWLGDRREDPTAATYSAEDLVLVQRDLGRLAVYTAEMGGSMEMYDLALRIPPWEPMHVMTRQEIADMGVETPPAADKPTSANVASALSAEPAPTIEPVTLTNGTADATKISERDWAMVEQSGSASLARRHPLTVEGDDIGSFDLKVSCTAAGSYKVVYIEHRHEGDDVPLAHAVRTVTLRAAGETMPLKVVASDSHDPDELVTYATGTIPAAMINGFGAQGDHSMFVETRSRHLFTSIRIGNTGVAANLPRLAASCAMPSVQQKRATLVQPAAGAVASAQ